MSTHGQLRRHVQPRRDGQRGMVRITGNTRDKQRAFNAAVSAQQFGENWLVNNPVPAGSTCAAGIVPSTSATLPICSAPVPANLTTSLPWATSIVLTQFTANTINGIANILTPTGTASTADTATQAASYYSAPQLYITDLGANLGSPAGEVYQVDAIGYGSSATTVAVVESTYVISSDTAKSPDK
jgi:type IV pilus assembly protein PilX